MNSVVKGIQMVNLKKQYHKLKEEMDAAVLNCMESTQFINGPEVEAFSSALAAYLNAGHVIPCANGTDALQLALMALDLRPGDEIIVPAFTYVATAEVIALLRLHPVMVDVDPKTFNVTRPLIEEAITDKTRALVPVHLFGQSADMEPIMELARQYGLFVIEDNAQTIGADYTFSDRTVRKTGTIGDIGCTSFYPSKNLGCYGDGGAVATNDPGLASRLAMIANHGQTKKYYHSIVGCNSRLDAMQAAVLNVKLKYLDRFSKARQEAAAFYDEAFKNSDWIETPFRQHNSSHVFHQYTLIIKGGYRDRLAEFLKQKGIPTMIYYPVPLYKQKAYKNYWDTGRELPVTEFLCNTVLSLPMHTELNDGELSYITENILNFFSGVSVKHN